MIAMESQEIQSSGSMSTMYHELAHRMECSVPQIALATNNFLERRTTLDNGRREPERGYGARGSGERVRPDHFADKYVGKTYRGAATEVFSVGTEALFSGRFGGLGAHNKESEKYSADPEHRNLILGLFATAARSNQQHSVLDGLNINLSSFTTSEGTQ